MNIRESKAAGHLLTLFKPLGKDVPLSVGETYTGEVIDGFPGGGYTLKIGKGYIPVRSSISLKKGAVIFLQFLGKGEKPGELVFRLLSGNERPEGREMIFHGLGEGSEKASVPRRLWALLSRLAEASSGRSSWPLRTDPVRGVIHEIIKNLSVDGGLVSTAQSQKWLRSLYGQLQGLITGVGSRLAQLTQLIPHDRIGIFEKGTILSVLYPSIEGLNGPRLKESLENSGVAFEARLKTAAALWNGEKGIPSSKIASDIKGWLLKLQKSVAEDLETLSERRFSGSSDIGTAKGPSKEIRTLIGINKEIDGLLKEVEVFQLLSRLTDSFYTYLPVHWDRPIKGELVFKRLARSPGSYSCGIFLELEGLGRVWARILMRAGGFFLRFKVENPSLKTLIETHLEDLKKAFERQGLFLNHIGFWEEEEVPTTFESLMEIEAEGETLINIRI